jgi:tight adherence protein C
MFLIVGLICCALAVVCLGWGSYRAFVEVPEGDRTYLDKPPVLIRILMPLIELISFRLGPWLSVAYRSRLQTQLRNAGLDFLFSPAQFFALKIIGAIFSGLVLFVLLLRTPNGASLFWLAFVAFVGFVYPDLWLKEQKQKRQHKILKALPFMLDVITLCVESGLNLTGALATAVAKLPDNPLTTELNRTLRDIRAGRNRSEALRSLAERVQMPAISSLVSALTTAEKQGMNIGPILRAQAEQRRNERFLRAEKLAMEAPVKMLFPLIAFIFPCTFIAIGFPIAMKFLQSGAFK